MTKTTKGKPKLSLGILLGLVVSIAIGVTLMATQRQLMSAEANQHEQLRFTQTSETTASVTIIDYSATYIVIPEEYNGLKVTKILDCPYTESALQLEKVYIPSSVSTIGENAFKNATNLQYFIFCGYAPNMLSSTLIYIGSQAFYNTTSISRLYIHHNMIGGTVRSHVFSGWGANQTIIIKFCETYLDLISCNCCGWHNAWNSNIQGANVIFSPIHLIEFRNVLDSEHPNATMFLLSDLPLTLIPANRSGYIFAGWFIDDMGDPVTHINEAPETGTIVLYARWIEHSFIFRITGSGASLAVDIVRHCDDGWEWIVLYRLAENVNITEAFNLIRHSAQGRDFAVILG